MGETEERLESRRDVEETPVAFFLTCASFEVQ